MLTATLRFPLGVYYALGARTADDERRTPEWPPSPVRLIGALIDAAHGQPGGATAEALVAIDRLASAKPPVVHAPVATVEWPEADQVAVLTGASRWAPRNPAAAEIKVGLSLRDLAGPRSAVDKGGIAVGDQPVSFSWPDLSLESTELAALTALSDDVSWLGTSRSPVLVRFSAAASLPSPESTRWEPLAVGDQRRADVQLRVPDSSTIDAFAYEYERRRSAKGKIESSGLQKPASASRTIAYARAGAPAETALDPRHWGQAFVLEVSPESEERPKASAAYLVARAVRAALLDQFAEAGQPGEAPAILRGRGSTPHAAFVPLPFVGARHADGGVKGVAIILPHPERLAGDVTEAEEVEAGLSRLLNAPTPGRVTLLAEGTIDLLESSPVRRPLSSLDLERTYAGPATTWSTVTPVVHSHWRAAKSEQALVDQIAADCAHVGLPRPVRIEVLRESEFAAAPPPVVDRRRLKPEWAGSVHGPTQHLRLQFDRPVRGPVILGRARHFGLGLMRPAQEQR